MHTNRVEMFCEEAASALLRDEGFVSSWMALHDKCPHATAFQAPNFVCAWYRAYRAQWNPVVALTKDASGNLSGLWLLAHDSTRNMLVNAGAHQAEYHAWLTLPGEEASFLSEAWNQLQHSLKFSTLRFKYLPAAFLATSLQHATGLRNRVIVLRHQRPLLRLQSDLVKASFAKKSNKSRFNRLKKLGRLEFRRVTDPAEFERIFDDLITWYDFRQAAVNGCAPFQEDPQKRRFHSEAFAKSSGDIHVTVTFLDDRLIAALWGMVSHQVLHLGMLMHSPLFAEHSPGKLHIMLLNERLLEENKTVLDLTPGGDEWKERFANAHDDVAEAIVFKSVRHRALTGARDGLLRIGRRGALVAGIQPDKLRAHVARVTRLRPGGVARRIRSWAATDRQFRVYRAGANIAHRYCRDNRVRCNSLSDLLLFEPGESWQTRKNFLYNALDRLERGELGYTISVEGRLAHSGWTTRQLSSYMTEVGQSITFPPRSVVFYDFYSHPDFRGRGFYRATLGHMLYEAFLDKSIQNAYICVLADNKASRHVIETMGFEYQCSYFLKRRFNTEEKWSSDWTSDTPFGSEANSA